MAADKRVAFIGLGTMGAGMAHRLLDADYQLTVFNRTVAKATALVDRGARLAATAAAAVADHDLVVLSLADDAAVESVLFGEVLAALPAGATVVDTSTVAPDYARRAAERLREHGIARIEACVVGNPIQARNGELRVFTAGPAEDVATVAELLGVLGAEVVHVGAAGNAAVLKLVLNLLLGAQVAALAEAVRYGTEAGLDRDTLLSTVAGTGFSSPVLRFRSELMRRRTYEPAFFRSTLMEKDLRLALAAGGQAEMPVIEAVRTAFAGVVAAGDGDKDAAVIVEHVGIPVEVMH